MTSIIELYYLAMLGVQLIHSMEELTNKFHSKFPLFKMSFPFFLGFEVVFFVFWLSVYFFQETTVKDFLMSFFILLMFANGLWHLVWWGISKKYVPGLITAPLFLIVFLNYYFTLI